MYPFTPSAKRIVVVRGQFRLLGRLRAGRVPRRDCRESDRDSALDGERIVPSQSSPSGQTSLGPRRGRRLRYQKLSLLFAFSKRHTTWKASRWENRRTRGSPEKQI